MTKTLLYAISMLALLGLVLAACAPATNLTAVPSTAPVSTSEVTPTVLASSEAQVLSMDIQILNTDPAQVQAVVQGNLTESCATLGESQVRYAGSTFLITIYSVSPTDRGCVHATFPFQTTIPLDTRELPAGSYRVIANGVSGVFTWPVEVVTPTVLPTVIAAATAAPASQACTDAAAFVADVTVPDNSRIAPGSAFTKTWRLKNTGTCTWDNNYLVSYISGTTMTQQPGYWILPQGGTVVPGQAVNVSIGMIAPNENGNYASYWGLKKTGGQLMPIQGGANGNSFYVKFKVATDAADGKITAASIEIEPEEGSGPACMPNSTYLVHAHLTADGATTAAYEIDSTAGQIAAGYFETSSGGQPLPSVTGTLAFDQADTRTVHLRFVGPYPYPANITVQLRVNRGQWYSAQLSCP